MRDLSYSRVDSNPAEAWAPAVWPRPACACRPPCALRSMPAS
ncbi:Uncharacterised protein [Bordetella pertussis]|nr:Uncharacterised protein [Bordetella pertussis]